MATIKESLLDKKNTHLLQMAKAIYDEVQSSVGSQIEKAESKILLRIGKMLEHEISDRLEKEFAKRLPAALAFYRKELEKLQKTYEGGQNQIMDLLKNLPPQPAPIVQVSVPPPRLVKKEFSYNQYGQPHEVVEREIEEKQPTNSSTQTSE